MAETAHAEERLRPAGAIAGPRWFATLRDGWLYVSGDILADGAPWLMLGLMAATLLMQVIEPRWLMQLQAHGLEVVTMVLLFLPLTLHSVASALIAWVLLTHGLSPGAAVALWVTASATGLSTAAHLRQRHGRGAAARFTLAVVSTAIGCGLVVNALWPAYAARVPRRLPVDALAAWLADVHAGTAQLHTGLVWVGPLCAAALVVVCLVALGRQGTRAAIGRLVAPNNLRPAGYHHDHSHSHSHSHATAVPPAALTAPGPEA